MKRKRLVLLFVAAVVLVAAMLFSFPYPRQLAFGPKMNGIPLCAWQEDVRRRPLVLANAIGEDNFLTRILEWLNQGTPWLDWTPLSVQEKEAVYISLADDPNPDVRKEVIIGLSQILDTSQSQAAMATYLTFLDDQDQGVFESACTELPSFSVVLFDVAFPKLISLLNHANSGRRLTALQTIGRASIHSKHFKEVISLQIRMIRDPDISVRAHALGTLAGCRQTKKNAKVAVPILLEQLRDEDALCRVEAARAVWHFTKSSAEPLPVLCKELSYPDAKIRTKAVDGLRAMGKHCLPAWDELCQLAVSDANPEVRKTATETLSLAGKKAVPLLISQLKDADFTVQRSAVSGLSKIGPDASEAAPILLSRVDDFGFDALASFKNPELVPRLLAMLEEKGQKASTRIRIVNCLGAFGPSAKIAQSKLLELLNDRDKEMRGTAASALAQIGCEPKQVLEVLVELMDDTDVTARISTIGGFYYLGPLAKDAVPLLIKRLQSGDQSRMTNAVFFLGCIGPEAKSAIPDLISLPKKPRDKLEVTEALGNIHQDAATVVPALLPQLKDKYPSIRLCTVKTLARFGSEGKGAVPGLILLVDDDDDEVSDAAVEALTSIDSERFPKKGPDLKLP